jgi:hypothetical protein
MKNREEERRKKEKRRRKNAALGGEKRKKKEIKGKGTRVWFERGEKWIRLSLPTKS